MQSELLLKARIFDGQTQSDEVDIAKDKNNGVAKMPADLSFGFESGQPSVPSNWLLGNTGYCILGKIIHIVVKFLP